MNGQYFWLMLVAFNLWKLQFTQYTHNIQELWTTIYMYLTYQLRYKSIKWIITINTLPLPTTPNRSTSTAYTIQLSYKVLLTPTWVKPQEQQLQLHYCKQINRQSLQSQLNCITNNQTFSYSFIIASKPSELQRQLLHCKKTISAAVSASSLLLQPNYQSCGYGLTILQANHQSCCSYTIGTNQSEQQL